MLPSLRGRRFRDATPAPAGDVSGDTLFEYDEESDGTVSARYAGGAVRLGYLVGTRTDDTLDLRYVHLTADGTSASGHCVSRIALLGDGRLQLQESWQWESREGAGTSVLEELPELA